MPMSPMSDNPWKNTLFTFFNETGAQGQMKGCDVLRAADQLNYTYEGEPAQVNEYCLRIIRPWWIYEEIILVRWPIPEIILSEEPITVDLDIKEYRQRLATLAESKDQTLLFGMDVEAERQPEVPEPIDVAMMQIEDRVLPRGWHIVHPAANVNVNGAVRRALQKSIATGRREVCL